jgi:stage V sporulation protein R
VKLRSTTLPSELRDIQEEIKGHAAAFGLDFFETIFELLDYDEVNMVAAYGGFPTRYPHWRFGMEYEQLAKSYTYGLSKIYELVINNDPSYAYLLNSNRSVDQKMVMAHVYGHVDFFKNNRWFAYTNRKMIDQMANHATRIRRYMERFGREKVEDFIDVCLSVDNLVDRMHPHIKRRREAAVRPGVPIEDDARDEGLEVPKIRSDREYMERFLNPADFVEKQLRRIEEQRNKEVPFPPEPERDVMLFLVEHAPLREWQRDVLAMIRDEAHYFAPQGQTKIMNEGWATYWHSRIMTTRALRDSEVIDYADHHAGVLGGNPLQVNPYKIGLELYRDIEDRWNRGRFGKDYDDCDDMEARARWDLGLGLGRDKIFQVRALYNDVTFLDEFLTEDFCRREKMFVFAYNENNERYEVKSRQFQAIKQKILQQLTNQGQPFIDVVDGNYRNRGEMLLAHRYEETPLKVDHAQETLRNLYKLWRRPCHIRTVTEDKGVVLSFDGQDHHMANA